MHNLNRLLWAVAVLAPAWATATVAAQTSAPHVQTYVPAKGAPLTYQQFSNSYYPTTNAAGQAAQPVTLQHYYSQLGLPIPGDPTARPVLPGATTTTPGATTTTPPAAPR